MVHVLTFLESLSPLPAELEQELRRALRLKELGRDKHWLQEGDEPGHLAFIETGLMKAYTPYGEKESVLWFYRERDAVVPARMALAIKALEPTRLHLHLP